jgi:hypothetical protein
MSKPRQLRQAVFLDRDGVLNESVVRDGKPYAPDTLAELRIPPGTAEALRRLREQEFLLLVVTNQPDVARGIQKREVVEEIHRHLRSELPRLDIKKRHGACVRSFSDLKVQLFADGADKAQILKSAFVSGASTMPQHDSVMRNRRALATPGASLCLLSFLPGMPTKALSKLTRRAGSSVLPS